MSASFVQIAVAVKPYLPPYIYALDTDGGVWCYDTDDRYWRELSSRRSPWPPPPPLPPTIEELAQREVDALAPSTV